jgi:hypothetical protein
LPWRFQCIIGEDASEEDGMGWDEWVATSDSHHFKHLIKNYYSMAWQLRETGFASSQSHSSSNTARLKDFYNAGADRLSQYPVHGQPLKLSPLLRSAR